MPTVNSLKALAGSSLEVFHLRSCPVADLKPLATLQSLTLVSLQDLPAVDLAPLAALPHLRDLHLGSIAEPTDLSPLAQTGHRLQIHLFGTTTVGNPGPLIKIKKN